mmetsp:Transcript_12330/g.33640  ORF Transcript_12330/g.33640 Transcript_12330/m.33640 type:complete len:273 (-) Transcript_12330:737-1555(-)
MPRHTRRMLSLSMGQSFYPLFFIARHQLLVCHIDGLELVLGFFLVVWVLVRVPLHGKLAIGLLDISLAAAHRQSQSLIVLGMAHMVELPVPPLLITLLFVLLGALFLLLLLVVHCLKDHALRNLDGLGIPIHQQGYHLARGGTWGRLFVPRAACFVCLLLVLCLWLKLLSLLPWGLRCLELGHHALLSPPDGSLLLCDGLLCLLTHLIDLDAGWARSKGTVEVLFSLLDLDASLRLPLDVLDVRSPRPNHILDLVGGDLQTRIRLRLIFIRV